MLETYLKNREYLIRAHSYDPNDERDGCGIGLVAAIDGGARREIVEKGIESLKAVWHRGAVDADGKTGDGAGIHIDVPQSFFIRYLQSVGQSPNPDYPLAVGQIFLPRLDLEERERCRTLIEAEILKGGHHSFGWRRVPIDIEVTGERANMSRPEIEQIIFSPNRKPQDIEAFERRLYRIRRRIERALLQDGIRHCYICSLSSRSLIYKGMFVAEQLSNFYPDLLDPLFISHFAVFHQRYSTNTFPTWELAQPFRILAHNGEINTIKGNINWMRVHEAGMRHPFFGDDHSAIMPVIPENSSDSQALDAVFEVLVKSGKSAPMVKELMIPQAMDESKDLKHRAEYGVYRYCTAVMEPWDGPAALVGYDGEWLIAAMDRNGLRPLRYTITHDGLLVAGSESGMVHIPPENVAHHGRIGAGETLALNLIQGKLYSNQEIKRYLAETAPFHEWATQIARHKGMPLYDPRTATELKEIRRYLNAVGITMEDIELILQPMIEEKKETTGSMGDDSPLAALSSSYKGIHHFLRQNFSQVTNPPIDSLRERYVMSLTTRLGNSSNILTQTAEQCRIDELASPVLTITEFQEVQRVCQEKGQKFVFIDCAFDPFTDSDRESLSSALERIRRQAKKAIQEEKVEHIVLSDEDVSESRVGIPMILAAGSVHAYLSREKLRAYVSLHVHSMECLDTHYTACLIGVGATTVTPYLAEHVIRDRHRKGLCVPLDLEKCLAHYKQALETGLLKIMSKMGISVLSSYRGGCNFEAIGLAREVVAEHFASISSRISGIGLEELERLSCLQHEKAYESRVVSLAVGSFYRSRWNGEPHIWEGESVHLLQSAVSKASYAVYQKYAESIYDRAKHSPLQLRELLDFHESGSAVPIEEVESVVQLRKRFVTPGMSLGALSPEAHGTLNVAMNRIRAKSDSGEGGEAAERYRLDLDGTNWNSAIKQVASGRFGVTAEYLNQCQELEIKIAQGAKPGEGGQLPGFKVTEMIAQLRHSAPGITLISPPPHHDIYSIEDLAQLIYDLKQINPYARVCVKLVSRTGIGTIASGVAKAKADVILVSGHVGGTGASPQTSIKFAGLPWEMGLSEVHQVLLLNNLRDGVRLRVDGGLKTGRDIVMAALLGADEFGVGTAGLVAMGCILVRQCHSNTCPVGVCTQDVRLRQKFIGTPEKVINLFTFLAEEMRELMASLGVRSLNEAIGRCDLLRQEATWGGFDLSSLLARPNPEWRSKASDFQRRNEVKNQLEETILKDAASLFRYEKKNQEKRPLLEYDIKNTDRTIGAGLSSMITRQFGMEGLPAQSITLRLTGTAGQSLGAFIVPSIRIEVFGAANDYVGKGLSGGTIIIRPSSTFDSHKNVIIGNTALYGATGGTLFARGQAGERFAVRNSGAIGVIEGCGSNGCEYMTAGVVVILGPIGDNFAAGMTGGKAFVYDPERTFRSRLNEETVYDFNLEEGMEEKRLLSLLKEYHKETESLQALTLINDWKRQREKFRFVIAKEVYDLEEKPKSAAVGMI